MNVVENNLHHGIRYNLSQFFHQLLQVLLVGLTIGITRTVVPALAESDFGMPRNSFVLLSSFVVAFGLVKAAMNFIAGRLSESIGRKKVLLLGWLAALPIPLMIWYAPTWTWIVTLMESVRMAIRSGSVDLNKLTPIDKCHGVGLKRCRVVHGGGRRLATNDRRGGQLGAHRRFHFMQPLVKAASSIAKPALAFCHQDLNDHVHCCIS